MAVIERKYRVDVEHVGKDSVLTNRGILSLMESIACLHSDMVGYGINQIEQTHLTWVLLHWKVKVFKRVGYGAEVTVKTWASYSKRFSTLRDFEMYDDAGNLICIASSKWALIDISTKSITKITEEIIGKYEPERKSVFEIEDIPKIKIPNIVGEPAFSFHVQRKDIDVNHHIHNTYYLDYAYEALPQEIYEAKEADEFEIMYKSGAKLGNDVDCYYINEEKTHLVVLQGAEKLHAIVKLHMNE